MQERERILELVKVGVISTEEALILLENIATEKDEKLIDKEATDANKRQPVVDEAKNYYDSLETSLETEDKVAQETMDAEWKDKEQLEEILSALAEEANQTSVKLDEVNIKIQAIEKEIREKEEEIMVLNTLEDLEELSDSKLAEREQMQHDLAYFNDTLSELKEKKADLQLSLRTIKKEQKENMKEEWKNKFDIPEDWKEQANETFDQVSDRLGDAGSQFGQFIKKTIEAVSNTVNDNVDWKDINIKVPGVATQTFSHEFVYPANDATIIDVKVANGKTTFKSWDKEDVRVEAEIKFYGKTSNQTPFEAFLERSDIEVDEDKISFQIPNKRIKADLTFYLPARHYDHISIKMLNGDIKLKDLEVNDIYLKTTNGDMAIKRIEASMLELESVNGDVDIKESTIKDLIGDSVNGDMITKAAIENIKMSLINGDIRVTPEKDELQRMVGSVVNGTIKVAVPKEKSLMGTCKTSFGSIKHRVENIDITREKKDRASQLIEFVRGELSEEALSIELTSTTGSILIKDTDK